MDKIRIRGGSVLAGTVEISGAKNAALPDMVASLLTAEPVHLRNLPYVRDILTTRRLLSEMGVEAEVREDGSSSLKAANVTSLEAPYELVKTMRASILVLGPLVARFGRARVSLPGGCAIGARPVNLHLMGLEKMGATCEVMHGYVEASTRRLCGAYILMDVVTVTGTENLMMAATLARGTTTLRNVAREPEIVDLADLLNKMGACVNGAGSDTIQIEGVEALGAAEHTIIPDRIETGTFIVAAALTSGQLEIKDCRPDHLTSIIAKLRKAGVVIQELNPTTLAITCPDGLVAGDVSTAPYPEFPTDMQAQYMVLMTQARGRSEIIETVFENRFMHASELQRMSAQIHIDGSSAIVDGPTTLTGARVIASDLRASASLVLAGLIAKGETVIDRVYHIDRGYEKIEAKLLAVGAEIERVRAPVTTSQLQEVQPVVESV